MSQTNCAVPGCKNTDTDTFLKFYSLPHSDKELCKEWIRRIGNPILYMHHSYGTQQMHMICEIHFDYICKTGSNSELHESSLPTLHLPIIKNVKSSTNSFVVTPISPSSTSDLPRKSKEDSIYLQLNMCSKICRICCRKGILYDIHNSLYNKKIQLSSIMKSLVPHYVLNQSTLRESLCLNCVKQILISYLTIIRIEKALKAFSFLLEPLNNKKLPKRVVNFVYPKDFDIKTVLTDCKLEISAESIKTYFSGERYSVNIENIPDESVDLSQPITQPIKTTSIDLPTVINSPELLNVTTPAKEVSNTLVTPTQNPNKSTDAPIKILNMTLNNNTVTKTNDMLGGNNTSIRGTISPAFKLPLNIIKLQKQGLIALPAPTQLKTFKDLGVQPSMMQLQEAGVKLVKVCKVPQHVLNLTQKRVHAATLKQVLENTVDSQTFVLKSSANVRQYGNKRKSANLSVTDSHTNINDDILNEIKTEVDLVDYPQTIIQIRKSEEKTNAYITKSIVDTVEIKVEVQSQDDDDDDDELVFDSLQSSDGESQMEVAAQKESERGQVPPFYNEGQPPALLLGGQRIDTLHTFICSDTHCQFSCETLPEYVTHITAQKHNMIAALRRCVHCNIVCDGGKEYMRHLKSHIGHRTRKPRSTYYCAHCTYYVDRKQRLVGHLRAKHGRMVNCPMCPKKLKAHVLANHIKRHENENRCVECNAVFDSIKLKKQHRIQQHPKVCLICSKAYAAVSHLRAHMSHHLYVATHERIECKFCHRKFKTPLAIRSHLRSREKYKTCDSTQRLARREANGRIIMVCPICGKGVPKAKNSVHMRRHSAIKAHGCDQCDYRSHSRGILQRHILIHTGQKPFLCSVCGQRYTQKVVLDTHMKMHTITSEPIKCKYCEETFQTRYDYRVHAQRHGIPIYTNPVYGSMFSNLLRNNADKLKIQLKMKAKYLPLVKKYICLECDKRFINMTLLKYHFLAKHEGSRDYFRCHYCAKPYDTYTRLRAHIHMVHVKRPETICELCQKVCSSRTHLQYHMTAHTGERRFICTICHAKFKTPGHLRIHTAGVHEDKRPHVCKTCDKAFRNPAALKEHHRTHTRERLTCKHCDKTFAGNSNRSKHMREVHKIRGYPIYTKSS